MQEEETKGRAQHSVITEELLNEIEDSEYKPPPAAWWFRITISVFYIALVFWNIYVLFLTGATWSSVHETTNNFGEVLKNLKKSPIIDFKISDKDCPEGYEDMIKYNFPGTIEGCNCLGSIKYLNKIIIKKCSPEHLSKGCSNIAPLDPKPFIYFSDQKRFCIKRLTGTNFLTQIPFMTKEGKCVEGYRLCGAEPEEPEHGQCIKKDQECPVTGLIITNNGLEAERRYSDKREIANGLNLYFRRDKDKSLISEFTISDRSVCFSNQFIPKNKRKIYPLTKDPGLVQYSFLTDNSFNLISDGEIFLSEEDLNKFNQMEYQHLPGFAPATGKYQYFSRSYISFSPECRRTVLKVIKSKNSVGSLKQAQKLLFFVGLALFLTIGCCIPCLKVLITICPLTVDWPGLVIKKAIYIKWGLKILTVPIFVYCVVVSAQKKNIYKRIASEDCIIKGNLAKFENMAKVLSNTILKKNIKALVMFLVAILMDVLIIKFLDWKLKRDIIKWKLKRIEEGGVNKKVAMKEEKDEEVKLDVTVDDSVLGSDNVF